MEGEFDFPNHRAARIWTARLVLHRILYLPVLKNILYASPLLRWLTLRLLGARVPFDMRASSDVVVLDPGLLEIGAGSLLGGGVWISGHYIDEAKIVLRRTRIGSNVNLFIRSVIFPGAVIEDDVTLGIETLLANDTRRHRSPRADQRQCADR
jgi:acetyltransferase-like isoleucine patch superfamily enzyme